MIVQQMLLKLKVIIFFVLPLVSVYALSAKAHSDTSLLERAKVYQQAVALLDQAEGKLADDDPQEAFGLAKEARSLFSRLQQECSTELDKLQLSFQQMEQEAFNNKLADELFVKGKQHEQTAAQKLAKSQELVKQGDKTQAGKLAVESQDELRLSLEMYVKSQIASLRNQQILLGFLKK
jgi:hypothetical protein